MAKRRCRVEGGKHTRPRRFDVGLEAFNLLLRGCVCSLCLGQRRRRRVARTLEGESGMNDPVAVLLVLGFIEWIQDPAYGLADLAALPHCGTVAGRDDPGRAGRLLELLVEELDRRRRGRPVRETAGPHPVERGGTGPWVLLLVDDWEAMVDELDEIDHGRAAGLLDRVVREGGSVGFRVVAAGGRRTLTGRVASSVPDRVVLRLSDPTDYALAGIAPRDAPAVMPPGRGLVLPGGHEVQLARPGPPPDAPAAGRARAGGSGCGTAVPVRLRALPTRARLDQALVDGKEAAGPVEIVAGSGTGELAGITGSGTFTAPMGGEPSLSLDYDFE